MDVFWRHNEGDVNFYRKWEDYKHGFGSLLGDFWLGNEAIHKLTNKVNLMLTLGDFWLGNEAIHELTKHSNAYSQKVGEAMQYLSYRLRLGSHSGTLKEKSIDFGLSYHNGKPFSTYDKDNDSQLSVSCAVKWHGAWWYAACYRANLNGKWGLKQDKGMEWITGFGSNWSPVYASTTEMKIRRI
ncbi:tenascin-X [Elysia marginata]|uniref:Tenascin-X n=1 Tax=Elysia marginata TaxID=1093978 RepID=A0AAV4IMM9_9GAST|nr:tenascin-X [Elysia marginata]